MSGSGHSLNERTEFARRLPQILETVRRYWGYDRLRPLQEEAIRAGLEQRDSLVVLPTGGGKSLCYQVPAALAGRTDVVVSPLIALMKDQVDGLRECGYPAAALHSGMPGTELQEIEADIAVGKYRLVFVAPERLLTSRMLGLLGRAKVRAFAIDEAHCISQWGHDFRPEYRQLATLKERFSGASVHAYTATATPRVRGDIVAQLRLRDPHVLVGTFDRSNLVYRVIPRKDVFSQTLEVVRRHAGQAVIVYCLSRRDTEDMADYLKHSRINAAAYHAGMSPDVRRRTQEAFAEEKLDVIAATVAFGMGIDRSDVRCVIHATMPKSIEHYQQETGRAGRDGLEAECVLLYSVSDVMRWEGLIEKSVEEAAERREQNGGGRGASFSVEQAGQVIEAAMHLLKQMQRFCSSAQCRHKLLSEYFGQAYTNPDCGACDVCLEEMECFPDSTVTAQKILSCVARVEQRFGVAHVVDVLLGAATQRIRDLGHDGLSTYGLLKDLDKKTLSNLVYQLLDQGLLERGEGDYPVLKLNHISWEVMRGRREVRLIQPKVSGVKRTQTEEVEWAGVDRELFESLRGLRRTIAEERGVPAYVIFGDATLRELARVRPASLARLIKIRGIGERKAAEHGKRFVEHLIAYCQAHHSVMDVTDKAPSAPAGRKPLQASRQRAFRMFAAGRSIESVAAEMGRARSTVVQYLVEYIPRERPARIDAWVDDATYARVASAAAECASGPLKPVFEKLGGQVPYDVIRLVVRHLDTRE